jgi:uncharacterized membrane protein YbhN (UPF0104 family)
LVVAVGVLATRVDTAALGEALGAVAESPERVVLALGAFAAAFALRAAVWSRVLPGLGFGPALAAVHLGLAANHLLPLRMGEAVRPLAAARRATVTARAATASTVVLRVTDMAILLGLGWLVAPRVLGGQLGWTAWAAPFVVVAALVAGLAWLSRLPERAAGLVRLPDGTVVAGTLTAWLLEAVLVWQCAHWAGLPLDARGAIAVTAASIAAQIAGVAPGGVGTYEAAAVGAYVALGFPAAPALAAALLAHALTTTYSLLGGAAALFGPSLLALRADRSSLPCPAPVEAASS